MRSSLRNRQARTVLPALGLLVTLGAFADAQRPQPRPAPRANPAKVRATTTTLRFALPPGESLTIDPARSFTDPTNPNIHAMGNPRLFFVFQGPTWSSPEGRARLGVLLRAAKDILDSGYLGGLAQYGFGKVTFNPATDFLLEPRVPLTIVNPLSPNDPNANQRALQAFLQKTLALHRLPLPRPGDNWRNSTIYVVMGDAATPGTKGAVRYGENDPWRADPSNPNSASLAEMIWAGFDAGQRRGPGGEYDGTTQLFAHELAEAISGIGLKVKLPGGRTPDGYQIADNDAALHTARLTAGADRQQVLVQSYFSNADQAFIIPGVASTQKKLRPARR